MPAGQRFYRRPGRADWVCSGRRPTGEDRRRPVAGTIPAETAQWFWSNQYETKLKPIGLFNSHEETILRGSHAEGLFTVTYLKDGQVLAADCINRPTDFNQVRAILKNRLVVDVEKLRDDDLQIKEAVLSAEITV